MSFVKIVYWMHFTTYFYESLNENVLFIYLIYRPKIFNKWSDLKNSDWPTLEEKKTREKMDLQNLKR